MDRFYTGNPVSDEPVQYVQFAEWQNELLETEDEYRESGCAYWSKVVKDLPSPPLLSFEDLPRDNAPYKANTVTVKLDRSVVSRMRDWSRSVEVEQSAILMASWQVLVSSLTGQSDFTIWTMLDGRKYQDMQNAVGLIAANVPIKSCIESSKHFCQVVQGINSARRDSVAAQEYYWGVTYNTDGNTGAADGFGFAYEDAPSTEDFSSKDLALVDISSCIEPFKLQLSCVDSTDGLLLEFVYDARRYHESDIRRLCDYYCVLLDSALEHPDVPIASLRMLPQPERDLILHEWNDPERVFPPVGPVHHLFERHVRAHPDAIALICEDEQLTYTQLNSRANRLAHLLQSRGVVPDMPVGLCLERSTDLIVGLLGILKSGGAYLPLDPALPRERLCAMLQDSNACLVVSQASLAAGLPGEIVLVDRDAHILEQQNAENPMSEVSGEHLAYVIYTSGSTGRPKGVCIEHRNLLNYIYGVGERLRLDVGASYATVSTLSADLGHTTLFSSLCMGGCLHLISSERAMDPLLWREYFTTHQIDCLKIVGSHLAALIGSGEVYSELLPRKVLVLGGEACRWELVDRILAGAPELRVLNHYGPTETTVGVLTYEVRAGMNRSVVGSATTPLGRPLANSRVYLLNDYQEPVGVGVVGEIYIGGSGVCRGYLNRPELTSERFLRDPFHEDSEARMYRSGDQGRYLSDGSVEFLGRMDHQVKIRGYRIELGEIENVLLRHGSVREAVIVAREDASGEKHLVGYVVGRDGPISGSELRDHLRVQLPEYMVPGWIVNLPRLPLTSNGKVDRSSLPSPEESAPDADIMGARTAVEEVLSGIWGELLHRDAIGVNQNFFELGGHSLLATQVISRIRETFEVEVPLRTIFEAPTIAAFAENLLLDSRTRTDIENMAEVLVSLSDLSEAELQDQLGEFPVAGAQG
jgi:amino acid adenylation domain-containing protein